MWAIIVLLICWLIATTIICTILYRNLKTEEDDKMSIKESMDLVNLPVVTFENNGERYNFIIDTGANDSIIDENCDIVASPSSLNNNLVGINSSLKECNTVVINFNYKNTAFETVFNVVDLSELFDAIKTNYGVTVHGILGTVFLDKYNYIIDFKDYIIYRKL